MAIFTESIIKLWHEWELQVTVLISLSLQIILIMLGNKRKYTTSKWVSNVLWLTYLSADWVAIVSLSTMSNMQGDSEYTDSGTDLDGVIIAFWAPFLLVHLGGPDTITAYSSEDNELWKRHCLELIVEVAVALYVLYRSLTSGTYPLSFLAIPIFFAGIVKYGERIWVLRSASTEHFGDSLLLPPDIPPNIRLAYDEVYEINTNITPEAIETYITPEAKIIDEAHFFFKIFSRLFVGLPLNIKEIELSQNFFTTNLVSETERAKNAFKLIELELGFLYDVLYTKASLVYSHAGIILRSFSFISTLSAFMVFLFIDKHGYSTVNVIISYVLLVGAIVIETYASILLLLSDWTMLWLSKHNCPLLNTIYPVKSENKRWSRSMATYNLIDNCIGRNRIDNCIGHELTKLTKCLGIYEPLVNYQQIDLGVDVPIELKDYIFEFILDRFEDEPSSEDEPSCEDEPELTKLTKCLGIYETLVNCRQIDLGVDVPIELKNYIFQFIVDVSENEPSSEVQPSSEIRPRSKVRARYEIQPRSEDVNKAREFLNAVDLMRRYKWHRTVKQFGVFDEIHWSVDGIDFDESIILWHIATDLRCHSELNNIDDLGTKRKISKLLSDYMLYLLVKRPFMLPQGIGKIRYQHTVDHIVKYFKDIGIPSNRGEVIEKLRDRVDIEDPGSSDQDLSQSLLLNGGDIAKSLGLSEQGLSKSLLLNGCELAESLKSLKMEPDKKWEMIILVWVEMLCYAAHQCRWNQHAQQLGRGGELITHVSLLMAHLGLTDLLKIKLRGMRT